MKNGNPRTIKLEEKRKRKGRKEKKKVPEAVKSLCDEERL
jgi:hypothetical protein